MIPNMYKIAGELLPCIHVSARALAYHALNIFGDHSDVMACRQTGFAMLCSNSVQEVMDLGLQLLIFLQSKAEFHSFISLMAFRTSHEIQKVECTDYDELAKLVDYDALGRVQKIRSEPRTSSYERVQLRTQMFTLGREASNKFYDALPEMVEEYMHKVSEIDR